MPAERIASLDGAIGPAAHASIAILDDGLLRGDGAFEFLKLYGGRPFALAEHLRRLQNSAAAIELEFDRGALEREVEALLAGCEDADAGLRIVITRGGRRILIWEPLPNWPDAAKLAGVTYSPSVILTGVKSISYAANMQATRLAQARGADEAILVRPDGVVLEAPTSTVFWTSPDGELLTPAISSGILESITRRVVVEALEVREGEFAMEELLAAGEAFLASTTREIQAISQIDETQLPVLHGPVTAAAAEALRAAVEAELR